MTDGKTSKNQTDSITNEALKGICNSNFELCHYAINLGRYYIHSGREAVLSDVIRDIRKHPDPKYIEELQNIDEIEREAHQRHSAHHNEK